MSTFSLFLRRAARFVRAHVPAPLVRAAFGAASLLAGASLAFAQNAHVLPPVTQKAPDISWWQAILLGLVQGLTEFIPVSSSAHLNITHALLHQGRNLPFDVFSSVGTILALAWYYRTDWQQLLSNPKQRPLLNLVLLACVPAVLVAVFSPIRKLEDTSKFFISPFYNGLWMILGGALLLVADQVGAKKRLITDVRNGDAITIGASQALALIPGFSRSGSTIAAGLLLGFRREDAARFSFLLSLPISIGAVVFEFRKALKAPAGFGAHPPEIILCIVAAAVSGFLAISFLLNYLKTRGMTPFFVWRIVVGLAAMAYFWNQR